MAQLHAPHRDKLTAQRSANDQQPHFENEESFLNEYTTALQEIATQLEQTPSMHQRAHDYIISHLPTFVYMDEYRTFAGRARLKEVLDRQNENRLKPEDETFLTILTLGNLDLPQLVEQGEKVKTGSSTRMMGRPR